MTGFGFTFNSGEDFLPFVKYDARAGRLSRVDRVDGSSVPTDITRSFKAIFDFENVEMGWIAFPAGSAPSFSMSREGEPRPPRPSEDHKQGIRVLVKLSKDCGGDVRELASNARSFLIGTEKVYVQYQNERANNPGKLPVIVLADTAVETTGKGEKKSTNYAPVWQIVSWVSRPEDLVYKPRQSSAAAPSAPPAAQGSFGYTPPSTGSTQAAPPPAPAAQPVSAEDDFG